MAALICPECRTPALISGVSVTLWFEMEFDGKHVTIGKPVMPLGNQVAVEMSDSDQDIFDFLCTKCGGKYIGYHQFQSVLRRQPSDE